MAPREQVVPREPVAPREPGAKAPPRCPPALAPTFHGFLQAAVGMMLVLGREVMEEYELAVASLTTAHAVRAHGPASVEREVPLDVAAVAAPGPTPAEPEVPPLVASLTTAHAAANPRRLPASPWLRPWLHLAWRPRSARSRVSGSDGPSLPR